MVARAGLTRIAMTAALLICAADATASQPSRELTPAAALATTRIMRNQVLPGHAIDEAFTSPDGKRYVLRTAYGDAKRNGVWMNLYTGRLGSLAAATPRRCAHLLTTGLGPQYDDAGANWDPTSANILHWVNNHQVAFLWSDEHEVRQVMAVDLESCRHRYLTHSATSVYAFAVGAEGSLLIDARLPRPTPVTAHRWEEGFTLPEFTDAWAVLRNDVDSGNLAALLDDTMWSVSSRRGSRKIAVAGEAVDGTNPSLRPIILSPDGRFVITYAGLKELPDAWRAYHDDFVQFMFAVNRDDPGRTPMRFLVFDLETASSHPLWSAPRHPRCEFAFSPDSRWVLAAPTLLPLPGENGVVSNGNAAAVIDVRMGAFEPLPIDLEHRTVVRLAWNSSERVEIQSTDSNGSDPTTGRFRRVQGHWAIDAVPTEAPSSTRVRIQIRQTLNDPPTVWAVSDGGERLLLDLNPHLKNDFKLGRVERRSGTLPDGHPWIAQLIYPAEYQPGTRYPLVIQSIYGIGFGPEEFTLDGSWGAGGMGLGPSEYPVYPGQLLAGRNIMVMQLELLHGDSGVKEAEEHQRLFETVTEELVETGLVDHNKVALAGFSRNGYWVEYTLTHSRFPFAAAIAQDNYDPSYFQSALANWWSFDADMNGAPAFGSGLQSWLEHAPGFNAERIQTPLRMMGQSLGGPSYIMSEWEIYSRLRHLHKPVEIAVMPDINRHPSHNTQNPRQIMAIQESSLDWFSFWLMGREDASPQKREQYARWHRFRDLQTSSTP